MKYSLDITNFLEEISSLSQSIVFLDFFALFVEEGLFISLCSSLELCIQLGISYPFSSLLLFLKPPQTVSLPSCIPFSLRWF